MTSKFDANNAQNAIEVFLFFLSFAFSPGLNPLSFPDRETVSAGPAWTLALALLFRQRFAVKAVEHAQVSHIPNTPVYSR